MVPSSDSPPAPGSPGSSSAAELASLSSTLEELCRRVTAIADGYAAAKRDDVATELYQAERALTSARRSLERVAGWERPA